MRRRGSGDRSGDDRHDPGTDRGVEDQVYGRTAADVARSVRPRAASRWAGAISRTGLPTGFRNCTSAGPRFGPGASSMPWSISSSPRPPAGATPGARSPVPGWCADGRAPSTWSPCASTTSSITAGRTSHCRRSPGRSPERGGMAGRSLASGGPGRPDEHAAAQGSLRDLLPQELPKRDWTKRSTRWTRSARPAFPTSRASVKRAGSRVDDRYDDPGFSGGTLDRPALRRLLRDIEAGKVDTVVCYQIDRLSRSLADFVRLVDVFERHGTTSRQRHPAVHTRRRMGTVDPDMSC